MKKLYIIVIVIISVFVLNSCRKDTDIFVPDAGQITGPDSTWYSPLVSSLPVFGLQQSLQLPADLDSIEVGDNADSVYSASGLQCVFPPHSCVDANGDSVNGTVYVSSYLLKGKGDLIRMGLPTVSNGNLLVSGGVFYIQLKNNNSTLQLAPQTNLAIQYADPAISQQMKLFTGATTADGQFNWNQISDTDKNNSVVAYNNEYKIGCNNLNWINCDHFYGDTSNAGKTTLSVKLPSNLTNANTIAYVVFNDIRSLMSMRGDATTKQFITSKVPVGMDVTIVTISKDGNFYYLGQQAVTTAAPAVSAISQLITITPARLTLDQIKSFLSTL